MALESLNLPAAARRRLTLDALNTLAQGDLAERLRLEAAARILCTARRAAELVASGELAGRVELPEAARNWDASVMTAREFAEAMTPAQIDALLADAPRWAAGVLDVDAGHRQAA
ncbi:hypothetical protein HMPREF9946_04541 [Acetobacteraceae bacterium AT-5844]|nr:hypothetical protein HMPREF9946_04541 [Acetobacteraceae bacterium AT-5844]